MSRKILCIVLVISMFLTAFVVGCAKKTIDTEIKDDAGTAPQQQRLIKMAKTTNCRRT